MKVSSGAQGSLPEKSDMGVDPKGRGANGNPWPHGRHTMARGRVRERERAAYGSFCHVCLLTFVAKFIFLWHFATFHSC